MLNATVSTLRSAPLLAGLPEDVLKQLSGVCRWSVYQPGDPIMRQNDSSTDICFILSGFVKIVRGGKFVDYKPRPVAASPERRVRSRPEIMVALVGPGDLVGEVSALLETGRSASVIALTPCEIIRMSRDQFISLIQQQPTFGLAVSRKLAQRLMEANRQVELMRGNVEARIRALIRHCAHMGIDAKRYLSNAEIARMVGATRVAVSQIINKLEIKKTEANPAATRSPAAIER